MARRRLIMKTKARDPWLVLFEFIIFIHAIIPVAIAMLFGYEVIITVREKPKT